MQPLINGITYITAPSFTENDRTGKPGGQFVLVDIEPDKKIPSISNTRKRKIPTLLPGFY